MKKIFSIFLVLILIVSSLTMVASASEVDENGDLETDYSVGLVNDSGSLDDVENGTDNGGTGYETTGSGYSGENGVGEEELVTSEDPTEEPTEAPTEPVLTWVDVYETVYTTSDVNYRNGPGTDYDIIGFFTSGTLLTKVAVASNNWAKVVYNDSIVYVNSKYLTSVMPADYVEPDKDPIKVDITEDSITAIADAVVSAAEPELQYEYQYEIEYSPGKYIVIDTNEVDLLNEHNVLIVSQGSSFYLFIDPSSISVYSDTSYRVLQVYSQTFYSATSVVSFDEISSLKKHSSLYFAGFKWSNYHVYASDGSLLFESTFLPPVEYIVSFNTGFSDLVIDSQIHNDLVLPNPTYAGYAFAGWYLDSDFETRFDLGTHIWDSDVTLFARWIDEPDMALFHDTIFSAFVEFFTYEPMRYIFALLGLVCIFAVGRRLVASRY